jgi:feruloyl esterase
MGAAGRLLVLGGLLLAPAAGAQNMAAFTDAGYSPVVYTASPARPVQPCAGFQALTEGTVTILSVTAIPEGRGTLPHCRIAGLIAPEIRFELNFPQAWNRRFYMFGNGGFAGETPETPPKPLYRDHALAAGFATAWTDTGHDARREPLGSFAADQQKLIDYSFRAVHLTAVLAKQLAARYYGRPPAYAYWDGCSTGGREGLMEAQRFPADFDGILAGAPVLNLVDTVIDGLWNARALAHTGLTLDKMQTVSEAAYRKCAGPAGVIEDPRRCDFDPARDVRQCAEGTDDAGCLTKAQAAGIKQVYAGPMSKGKPYFFGFMPGAEVAGTPFTGIGTVKSQWDQWLIGRDGGPSIQLVFAEAFLKYAAYPAPPNPSATLAEFDFDRDPERMGEVRALLNADDPDLAAFRQRGGRMIMYHGWADTALSPLMSIDYYQRALAATGPDTDRFFRLFMVPGMAHCRGGIGTDKFDAITALIRWVENGQAPAQIPAARVTNGRVDRYRPLCPFPQQAIYDGRGSVDEAASYKCGVVK